MHHVCFEPPASLKTQRTGGHRGVDVAINKHQIRLHLQDDLLEAHHDLGRLHRMRTRADLQIDIRRRYAQLREENIRHVDVIVLARVDQNLPNLRIMTDCPMNRRDFHKIRPGDDDVQNNHCFQLRDSRGGYKQSFIYLCLSASSSSESEGLAGRHPLASWIGSSVWGTM